MGLCAGDAGHPGTGGPAALRGSAGDGPRKSGVHDRAGDSDGNGSRRRHIDAETVDRYRNHGSRLGTRATDDGTPEVDHVLHVLRHDGYLEPEDGGYRFVSRLLEDWWRGRYGQRFVPVFDRQR